LLAGRVNYNSIGGLLSRQCCDESMKICYEAIKAGVKLLPTSFLYAVGREDNSRYFVLKCLPEPMATTLLEKTLISRGQPRSQGLSSPHPKGSEGRKTLAQAGHVSW